ncbi:MAG TPA: TetR-like C-terminal domain-containing protein [Anaerolineaceae bacterium]|nr:TetR-like C-terminal domain-containing protein [Anaerolineaceae bacterium]
MQPADYLGQGVDCQAVEIKDRGVGGESGAAFFLRRGAHNDVFSQADPIDCQAVRGDLGTTQQPVHHCPQRGFHIRAVEEAFFGEGSLSGQVDQEISQRFIGELPPGSDFYGYLAIFEHAARNRELYRLMLGSQGASALTRRVYDYFIAETEREITERHFFPEYTQPAAVMARYVTGAIMELIIWWIESPNPYTPHQMADMVFHMLHKA